MARRKERDVAMLKVLAATAWADGRLDNEEVNRIKDLMLAYDLDSNQVSEIHALLDAPVSYERCETLTRELMGMLHTRDERRAVIDEVGALMRADGKLDDSEREVLEGLKGIMEAMDSVDHFMSRITNVFRRILPVRDPAADPGELSIYLKNAVLHRLHDLSHGAWMNEIDPAELNRYTLFGAVLGRVADAEDGISAEETARIRELLEERFELRPPLLDWVVQAVQEASTGRVDRQGLLAEFNRVADMDERRRLLDAAFAVAAADGVIGAGELEELRRISNFLWIDPRVYNDIRARWIAELK